MASTLDDSLSRVGERIDELRDQRRPRLSDPEAIDRRLDEVLEALDDVLACVRQLKERLTSIEGDVEALP